jgi:hypothetical protein
VSIYENHSLCQEEEDFIFGTIGTMWISEGWLFNVQLSPFYKEFLYHPPKGLLSQVVDQARE